ncbi:FGGY family carbohydrate kinase, partial [Burkholderia sp. WTPI3]|uniref:FGGY family carbohydrate kinase n=1 Tax=Burkholderia sp. WTPI3 TaxID=2822167 RepID=UPI002285D014
MKRGVDHRETAAGVRFTGFIALQNSADPRVKYRRLYGVYRACGIVAKSTCEKSCRVNPRAAVFAIKVHPGATRRSRPRFSVVDGQIRRVNRGAYRDPAIIDIRSFEYRLPVMRLLGIDLGTGSVKLVTLDADGIERAVASEPYSLSSPQPGWAEISPHVWWDALARAAAKLPAGEREQVVAIGFSGQMHGVVLIDAAGQPVRPALLWPDTRAVREADAATRPDAGLPVAPNPVAPGMAGPLLRWLAEHEPQSLRAARWAVQPKDWLRIALGGDVAADPSDACATALATPDGAWDAP